MAEINIPVGPAPYKTVTLVDMATDILYVSLSFTVREKSMSM